jgi:hypothetical protein
VKHVALAKIADAGKALLRAPGGAIELGHDDCSLALATLNPTQSSGSQSRGAHATIQQ